VVGWRALPELLAVAVAAVLLFAVGGLGLTRLLLPAEQRRHELIWALPVGACAVALTLTVLGFAQVPFKVSLGIVIALGVAVGAFAFRRRPGVPQVRCFAWPAYVAMLLAAVSLIPLFRAGFVTVEGQGQDAHLAVGTAQFLQKHPPQAIAISEPVDRVPLVWRSKQPIYYALAAVATLSGREVFETISCLAAMMLALACMGFFLVARELLRAPPWAAVAGMGLVGLNPMVLHTVMHPYFNQTWGFFAMPFAMVLAPYAAAQRRTRATVALLLLFLAVCGFAYPLALPLPLLVLAVVLWPERRALSPRRLYRGRRSLLWIVPLSVILIVPIVGVIEKAHSAFNVVFNPGRSLQSWGGDVFDYFPEAQFLGVHQWAQLVVVAPLLAWGAFVALRAAADPTGADRAVRFRGRVRDRVPAAQVRLLLPLQDAGVRGAGAARDGGGGLRAGAARLDRGGRAADVRQQRGQQRDRDDVRRAAAQHAGAARRQRGHPGEQLDPDRHRADRAELDRVHAARAPAVLAASAAEHELSARADLAQGGLHPHGGGRRASGGRCRPAGAAARRVHAVPPEAVGARAGELLARDGADRDQRAGQLSWSSAARSAAAERAGA
jgi:hypothetical protein